MWLSILTVGEVFGELTLIGEEHHRTTTVQALEPTETLVLRRGDFEELRALPRIRRVRRRGERARAAQVQHLRMHHRDAGELRADECRPARTNAIPGAASLSPVDVDERVAEQKPVVLDVEPFGGPLPARPIERLACALQLVVADEDALREQRAEQRARVQVAPDVGVVEEPRQLPRQLAVPTQVEARGHREPGRRVALPGGAGAAIVEQGRGAFRAVDGGPEASVEEVTDPADELRERQRVRLVDPPRQRLRRAHDPIASALADRAADRGDVPRFQGQGRGNPPRFACPERQQGVASLEVRPLDGIDHAQADGSGSARIDPDELRGVDRARIALTEGEPPEPDPRPSEQQASQRAPRRGGHAHVHAFEHCSQGGDALRDVAAGQVLLRGAPP